MGTNPTPQKGSVDVRLFSLRLPGLPRRMKSYTTKTLVKKSAHSKAGDDNEYTAPRNHPPITP